MQIAPSRSRRIPLLLAASLLLIASTCRAQDYSFTTARAANALVEWFTTILKPFSEIGATAERQSLVDGLLGVNRKLFELEQEKRYLLIALQRNPRNISELTLARNQLMQKLSALRRSILDVAPKVRVAYRAGADPAIEALSAAVVTRKAFIDRLESLDDSQIPGHIEAANQAIEASVRAQKSLADVIAVLQKS